MATALKIEEYVTCPIDKHHRIIKKRLQPHINKCLKANGLLDDKMMCPFNPMHIIFICDKEKHIKNECDTYANILLEQSEQIQAKNFSGSISMEEVQNQLDNAFAELEINSDNDYQLKIVDCKTYDPVAANINNPTLYRTLNCEPKAARKAFCEKERKRHAETKVKFENVQRDDEFKSYPENDFTADENTFQENSKQLWAAQNLSTKEVIEEDWISVSNQGFEEMTTEASTLSLPAPATKVDDLGALIDKKMESLKIKKKYLDEMLVESRQIRINLDWKLSREGN